MRRLFRSSTTTPVMVLILLIGVAALVHLALIFPAFVKGDEFRFLSDIYSLHRGTLTGVFQRFHTHLFRWLPAVGGDEINQIMVARVVYFFLLLGSCGLLFSLSRAFLSREASLFAVFCLLAFGQVLTNGTSFRYDGITVFFLLATLVLLLRSGPSIWSLSLSGAAAAIAFLITLKSLFFLPTLILVVLLRRPIASPGERIRDLGAFGISASAVLAIAGVFHFSNLADGSLTRSTTFLQRAGGTAFSFTDLFPASSQLLGALLLNGFIWIFIAGGAVVLLGGLKSRVRIREAVLQLSLLLPLLSLLVYRNAFAYFYLFIMPTCMVAAGAFFDHMADRAKPKGSQMIRATMYGLSLAVFLNLALNITYVFWDDSIPGEERLALQQEIVDTVHRVFPDPVPYIDGVSMISSFPKVGFFLSAWGWEGYLEGGEPIFRRLLQETAPVFLLADRPGLWIDLENGGASLGDGSFRLFSKDLETLRDNYVPHWGVIFVAGKQVAISAAEPQDLEILIGGDYTVEAEDEIFINGTPFGPGEFVFLPRGMHRISSVVEPQTVTLRWGRDLFRPTRPFPAPSP